MNSQPFDNHGIPAHFENYTCIVTQRGKQFYIAIAFNPAPPYFEPHSEHGIDIFLRNEWSDAIKVCYQNFIPDAELRGKLLRHIRATFYPTAKFHCSLPPTAVSS